MITYYIFAFISTLNVLDDSLSYFTIIYRLFKTTSGTNVDEYLHKANFTFSNGNLYEWIQAIVLPCKSTRLLP